VTVVDVLALDVAAAARQLTESLDGDRPMNLIDGRWRAPTGSETEEQFDPSSGATIGTLRYSSDADVDAAVAAAGDAQPDWSRRSVDERAEPLTTVAAVITARRALLVPLIAIEVGKTLAEAHEEVDLSVEFVEMLADTDRSDLSQRRPLGVASGISLYHYPLLTPLWLALPALTAGNGYVLRPCTWSPVASVAAAEVIAGSGYPAGLFNAVHGSLDTVNCILAHPGLAAVSYVGSGPWAQYMVDVGTRRGKRVHSHGALRQLHVVADDADPEVAARRVCQGAIGFAGQRWLAGCTVVAGDPIASEFVDALSVEATAVRVGASTDPAMSMGPLVQRFRQRELVDRVRDAGDAVEVSVDGSGYADGDGYYFGPTVVDRVPVGHPLLVEQVPGPIISIVRDRAGEIDHRDAAATVTTVHDGTQLDGAPRTPSWFGSLPWNWGHAVSFFSGN
jgi:malonate-semialdehyde dehydrogenase (acetylating)/methylmalonate-semialdehyde dehydrogenase